MNERCGDGQGTSLSSLFMNIFVKTMREMESCYKGLFVEYHSDDGIWSNNCPHEKLLHSQAVSHYLRETNSCHIHV